MLKKFDTAKVVKSGNAEFHYYTEGGGYLHYLALEKAGKTLSVLPTYDSEAQVKENPNYRCTVLFPFPNRLRDGKYTFEGKEYQFPVNESHRGNSLHGFLKEYTPEVEIKGADSNQPSLLSRYVYRGEREYYPFPAEILVEYTLRNAGELEVSFTVNNTGDSSMPVGTGWHPYFQLAADGVDEKIDEFMLKFPESNRVLIDERMIPTGETPRYDKFDEWKAFGDTELDDCFIPLKGGVEEVAVRLWSEKAGAGIEVWQDKNFGYIQVYTPPDRESIAVEPMNCNINAFQNRDGLSVLAPGESFSGKFGVRMITSR